VSGGELTPLGREALRPGGLSLERALSKLDEMRVEEMALSTGDPKNTA
jgi:hypothetical protein